MNITEQIKIRSRINDIDRMLGDTRKFSSTWKGLVEKKQKLVDKLRSNKR